MPCLLHNLDISQAAFLGLLLLIRNIVMVMSSATKATSTKSFAPSSGNEVAEVPKKFICPLTLDLMQDPVVSRYGQSYERSAIVQWLAKGNTACPMTRQPLRLNGLVSHNKLRLEIDQWKSDNGYWTEAEDDDKEEEEEESSTVISISERSVSRKLSRFFGVVDVSHHQENDGDWNMPYPSVVTVTSQSPRNESSSIHADQTRMQTDSGSISDLHRSRWRPRRLIRPAILRLARPTANAE